MKLVFIEYLGIFVQLIILMWIVISIGNLNSGVGKGDSTPHELVAKLLIRVILGGQFKLENHYTNKALQ